MNIKYILWTKLQGFKIIVIVNINNFIYTLCLLSNLGPSKFSPELINKIKNITKKFKITHQIKII